MSVPMFILVRTVLDNGEPDEVLVDISAIITVEPHGCINPDECQVKSVLYLVGDSEVVSSMSVAVVAAMLGQVTHVVR